MNREPLIHFNFYDFLTLLVRWRKLFLVNFIIVAILSSIIAFILPVWYTATTVILPPGSGGGGLASLLPKDLVGMASGFGLEAQNENIYYSILASRTLKERIIDKFELKRAWKFGEERYPEDVLDAYDSHTTIDTREDLAIVINFEDRDPELAQAVANGIAEELDQVYRELTSEMARNNRIFIEKRLNEANDSLDAVQDSMMRFQQRTGVVSLPEQLQAMVKAAAELKGQQLANDINLEVMRRSFSSDHPMIAQLSAASREMEAKYESMVGGREGELFVNLQEVPLISRQFADLYRKTTVQTTLIEYLYPQYESARIQEQKETGNVQVIDWARVPERKTRPLRKRLVMIACIVCLLVTLLLVLLFEYWKALPERNAQDYEKVRNILSLLRRRR